MLAWIQTFLSSLGDIINSVIQFFTGLVEGLMSLIKMLPSIISASYLGIGYLPNILKAFAFLTISICVVFLIVGRNTGNA